jgi:uncharacterized protein DUF4157
MRSYIQTKPAARQTSGGEGAAEHRTATHASLSSSASESAGAEPLNRSPQAQSLLQLRHALDEGPGVRSQVALQRALNRPATARAATPAGSKRKKPAPVQKKANATGLPDHLKAGVEHLSGLAMDDVRVHYNSPKPATVQAHAFAQGTDIHIGPGQEHHLPHEAWHVVQQKQGRVKPTLQLKGVAINDDGGLEREADGMGMNANRWPTLATYPGSNLPAHRPSTGPSLTEIVQFMLPKAGPPQTEGLYNAQKNQQAIPYQGGRGNLTITPPIRRFVLTRAGMSEFSKNVAAASHSGQVPLRAEAVQCDHDVPWDTVSKDLFDFAQGLKGKTSNDPPLNNPQMNGLYMRMDSNSNNPEYAPTMYAARMYYNDVYNLKPASGGFNASKSNRSDVKSEETHPETDFIMLLLQDALDQLTESAQSKAPNQLQDLIKAYTNSIMHLVTEYGKQYGEGS